MTIINFHSIIYLINLGSKAQKMDFLATEVAFRPFLAIFRYFPLLSVTSFPLAEGHNDRWSGQEYSREPLDTFILSFTRLILALEPKKKK